MGAKANIFLRFSRLSDPTFKSKSFMKLRENRSYSKEIYDLMRF